MNKTKTLNNFKINPIGIGTWMMGGGYYRESKVTFATYDNDSTEIEAIKYSIQKGQNHIDTAVMYAAGHSEELVGKAIQDYDRDELFIADKLYKSHLHRTSVVPAVKDMLRRLKTDYIDLLYVHSPWDVEPMKDYISGLNDSVDAGLARSIGVSNFNLKQLKQAMEISKHPIVANQNRYNVLYKTEANTEMLDFCKKHDIMIVAYRPVERKLLADETEDKTVKEIADKYKKTPAQIALNWLIQQDNVVAIPKSVSKEHIDENLEALNFELKEEDIQKLNTIPSID